MQDIESILTDLKNNKITIEEAKTALNLFSLEMVEDKAVIDSGRYLRKGIPEVIYAEKKDPRTLEIIVSKYLEKKPVILVSRVLEKHLTVLQDSFSKEFNLIITPSFEPYTVTISNKKFHFPRVSEKIGLLTAGTSDIPVAEEAKAIARLMGVDTIHFNDVGIAGVHRLFEPLRNIVKEKIKVIIVVAGMEGALPAIVSSLVQVPIIGVPTSTGYGYGGKGIGALMTMLQTCSPGLVVVNIDNGINAGATAALIARQSNSNQE